MTENSNLKTNLESHRRTHEQLEALQSELVMQESIYNQKMTDMQMELNHQIDEINTSKESEVDSVKSRYAELFHEKAEELQTLRADSESNVLKINQQSRTISDLQFNESELNALLSKKQSCHHKEFEKSYTELQSEMEFLREISIKSEKELQSLREKFAQFQSKMTEKVRNCQAKSEKLDYQDSGIPQSSSSNNSQNTSNESFMDESHQNVQKKKRSRKKRK